MSILKKVTCLFVLTLLAVSFTGCKKTSEVSGDKEKKDITIRVNGKLQAFTEAPVKEKDDVMVELSSILKDLKAEQVINGSEVTVTRGSKKVALTVNKATAVANEKELDLGTKVKSKNNSIMVPLQNLCEALGVKVNFHEMSNCYFVTTDQVFKEDKGLLVMEVESAPAVGKWAVETEYPDFKGSCYYTWRGQELFSNPGQSVLAYKFVISDPGEYNLIIRNRHDYHDSTEENDCFVRVDGGEWMKTASHEIKKWTLETKYEHSHENVLPAKNVLEKGIHTLEISPRSEKFSIDRIILTKDEVNSDLASLEESEVEERFE